MHLINYPLFRYTSSFCSVNFQSDGERDRSGFDGTRSKIERFVCNMGSALLCIFFCILCLLICGVLGTNFSEYVLAWLPLQSLVAKKKPFFLCEFWAAKNFQNLLKSAGEIFLSSLRGAKKCSLAFRIVLRIFFRVFQTVFRIDLNVFRGQFRSADMPP